MLKDDCGRAIRSLCHRWRRDTGQQDTPPEALSFSQFHGWLQQRHGQYLEFRSVLGPREEAERWFDQEFGQTWRN